ncbi:MAG TPA: hypothetical protein VFF86_08100 [Candidatus Methylomirabilis sp.]|nr:hypothetical protein [Candidatus Methylomirabilis sp.]
MKAFREHLAVLAAYTVFTLLLTYPIAFQLSTHLLGDDRDTNIFVWNLWWIKKALTELHTNPFWTDYLFYPEGVSLVFHSLVPFNGLLGIPLQALVGPIVANNLIVFLAFILSGYGAYLLIRYLITDRLSAFIGGMIFAFCPYKFAHLLGHFDLISTEWIPFYVLALLKLTNHHKQAGTALSLSCAIFLLLTALCAYYYLFYALIFTALFAVYRVRTQGFQASWERDCRKFTSVLGLFLIGFAPFLAMAANDLLREGHMMVRGWGGATGFQADLLSFITPSPLHPLFGSLVKPIASRFSGNLAEATVFAGYIPLALGLVAMARLRSTEPWVRFWSLALLVFFILSLGPFPRILGKSIKLIPLPGQLIMRTPILNNLRVPSRFDIMIMLSLAVLAGFSCRHLLKRFKGGAWRALVFLGITLTITFEYLAIPFPTFKPSVPRIYEQIAREPGPFTVLQVPLGWRDGIKKIGVFFPSYLYYQAVHGKKIVGGYISRVPDAKIDALAGRPLLRKLLELQGTGLPIDAMSGQPGGKPLDDVLELRIRYVIIHPPFDRSRVRDYVEATLPVEKVVEENGVVAYRIKVDAQTTW